ncbi:hypothetical protein [Inconstantimicrobium mannanitabidum]|uniref:Uncharacterized protein n=1 Tax=Inconstantimicrobium mannanitabidum TaxID=1604901 RepID=A0ACB5R9Q8_9CLOT|nr:hypothetical protein [Clostridium sp. TW13]GKX65701.1 hypothetical protein rsdtw13_09590 [Clostridium sp. TW13]
MIKKKKLFRNIVILLIVFCIIVIFYPASVSPITALKRNERAKNYGPSVIIKTEKFNNEYCYLCKYDKWYSIDIVKRGTWGLWYPGEMLTSGHLVSSEPVEYIKAFGAGDNGNKHVLFGRVNDRRIKSVKFEIEVKNKTKVVEQRKLYDNLFMIFWDGNDNFIYSIKDIQGLDENSKVVFEKKIN